MTTSALQKLSLSNFTLFDSAELNLSPGINVFLGQNATGKTHLLKLLYAVSRAVSTAKDLDRSKTGFATHLSKRLIRNFQLANVGRLASRIQGHKHCAIRVVAGGEISFEFSTRHRELDLNRWQIDAARWPDPVYLPTKEVLSMFHGLVSAMAEDRLELEELYVDLALKLGSRPGSGKRAEWQSRLMEPLERMLKATVEYDEKAQRFFIRQRGIRLEAGLAAEGYRKIGMLLQLVANRSLAGNSVLFWDEPEVNINPSFAEPLAELLSEFARQGTQVVLATHDYFVLKYLGLVTQRAGGEIPIRYFSLFREREADKFVQVEQADDLYDLQVNPVMDEFERLYAQEAQHFYGAADRKV